MAKSTIDYLRERTTDVKDAAQRLLENLSGASGQQYDVPEDAVLVAEDLSPADLSMLEGDKFQRHRPRYRRGNLACVDSGEVV